MVDEQGWQYWRTQELQSLGQLISWADRVFTTCEVGIEGSRHYGTALLVHGIETARAIRLCLQSDLIGPAFALARSQYEGVLRGHIIIHEIGLQELNELLLCIQEWRQGNLLQQSPPKIEVRGKRWRCVARGIQGGPNFGQWRTLESKIAILWQESVGSMGVLHDLTHAGMTQALQMMDSRQRLGVNYSVANQTQHLYFAEQAVMFTIMTWPGAMQKYELEIERRAQRISDRARTWGRHTQ